MPGDTTTTAKGARTRERIVAAAASLMHRHGVAGTAIPAVRVDAGVSSSQIYHYFTDKDELTLAVVAWWADRIVTGQVAVLDTVQERLGLVRWRDDLVDGAADHDGCPLGGLADELADRAWARAATADGFHHWHRAIRQTLVRLVDLDELETHTDPDRHATALLAAVQGGLLLGQTLRSTCPLEVALDTALDHLAWTARPPR